MTVDEVRGIIDENEELEMFVDQKENLIVSNSKTGRFYRIASASVGDLEVKELRAFLMGEREAQELITITRVIGYYSQVQNWNRSKVAELADRRKGTYALSE